MKGGTSLSKGWNIIHRFSEDIDISFDPPADLNVKGEKPAHIAARFGFYDELAAKISIPGIKVERVQAFIGTQAYAAYKTEKIRGADATEFAARTPFTLPDTKSFELFDQEYDSMNSLLLGPGPKFKEVIERLRQCSPRC